MSSSSRPPSSDAAAAAAPRRHLPTQLEPERTTTTRSARTTAAAAAPAPPAAAAAATSSKKRPRLPLNKRKQPVHAEEQEQEETWIQSPPPQSPSQHKKLRGSGQPQRQSHQGTRKQAPRQETEVNNTDDGNHAEDEVHPPNDPGDQSGDGDSGGVTKKRKAATTKKAATKNECEYKEERAETTTKPTKATKANKKEKNTRVCEGTTAGMTKKTASLIDRKNKEETSATSSTSSSTSTAPIRNTKRKNEGGPAILPVGRRWSQQLECHKKGSKITDEDRIETVCGELETLATQNCWNRQGVLACRCLSILSQDVHSKKAVASYLVSNWCTLTRHEQKLHLISKIQEAHRYEEQQQQQQQQQDQMKPNETSTPTRTRTRTEEEEIAATATATNTKSFPIPFLFVSSPVSTSTVPSSSAKPSSSTVMAKSPNQLSSEELVTKQKLSTHYICRESYLGLHRVSHSMQHILLKHARNKTVPTSSSTSTSPSVRPKTQTSRSSNNPLYIKTQAILPDLRDYFTTHILPLATPSHVDRTILELPVQCSKRRLYRDFIWGRGWEVIDTGKTFKVKGKRTDAAWPADQAPLPIFSEGPFKRYWDEQYPTLVVRYDYTVQSQHAGANDDNDDNGGGGTTLTATRSSRKMRGGPWSTAEHECFMAGYDKWGHGNWKQIMEDFLPTRNNKQICSYAIKVFGTNKIGQNGTSRGPWTAEERANFRKGYDHCGHGNWIQIRDDFVPTRTNKQICSHALMCFGPEHFKLMKQKRKATTTTRSRTAIKSKSTGKKLPKKQKFDADDEELSDSEDVTNQYHRTDHGYSNTGGGNNHGGTQV